jgi:hypothetical protein
MNLFSFIFREMTEISQLSSNYCAAHAIDVERHTAALHKVQRPPDYPVALDMANLASGDQT